MIKTKLSGVKILVMANGYVVGPHSQSNEPVYTTSIPESYVFETIDSLFVWLKENIGEQEVGPLKSVGSNG